jgi:hypothetical protein
VFQDSPVEAPQIETENEDFGDDWYCLECDHEASYEIQRILDEIFTDSMRERNEQPRRES